ncbi:MAG TPA: hypothetical protein VF621_02170 [Pyrinomonadaceae bacterium]
MSTPFGKHPATLVFEGTGGALTAHITSRLGDAPLESLTVTHDGFDARVTMDFQGKPYAASIKGQVEHNDALSGTIKVSLPIAPAIRYTGTRAA